MVALRSLTDDERAEVEAELAETRAVLQRLRGRRAAGVPQLLWKLDEQIAACVRHVLRMERTLEQTTSEGGACATHD